jgi:hypothetical protein
MGVQRSTAGSGVPISLVVEMLSEVIRLVNRLCRDKRSIKRTNNYNEDLSFDSASRRRSNAQYRVLRARMRSVIGRGRYGDGKRWILVFG